MKSKYRAVKVCIDNIKFDSKVESEYYLFVKNLKEKGYIKAIELQPKFLLQPKFTKGKKKHRDIFYVADFLLTFNNGRQVVVDIKGMPTEVAKLKRKLFDYRYQDIQLIWLYKKSKRWVKK